MISCGYKQSKEGNVKLVLSCLPYSSQDLVGVQLGGALKNPLAAGAGMIEGAGYGIN